jgi:hypothetical protein
MNVAELADGEAVLIDDDVEDGCVIAEDGCVGCVIVEDGCVIVEDGCVISVDLAAGALVVEVDEGGCVISVDLAAGAALGDFTSSAANAEPIIRPPMAVVIMSFLSIGDPP